MGVSALAHDIRNFVWAEESAPSIHEKIKTKEPSDLIAYHFERIEPALAPEVVRECAFAYAMHVSANRLIDVGHRQQLQVKRLGCLDKQLQHLQELMQAATDKTNKVERWLSLGSMLSMGLMFGGGQLPGIAGKMVETFHLDNLPMVGDAVGQITQPDIQKLAVGKIKDFGPQIAQMPTMYANISGELYGAKSQKDGAMAQFYQGLESTWSAQKQDVKQNEKTLHDVISGVVSIQGRLAERVAQAAAGG